MRVEVRREPRPVAVASAYREADGTESELVRVRTGHATHYVMHADVPSMYATRANDSSVEIKGHLDDETQFLIQMLWKKSFPTANII